MPHRKADLEQGIVLRGQKRRPDIPGHVTRPPPHIIRWRLCAARPHPIQRDRDNSPDIREHNVELRVVAPTAIMLALDDLGATDEQRPEGRVRWHSQERQGAPAIIASPLDRFQCLHQFSRRVLLRHRHSVTHGFQACRPNNIKCSAVRFARRAQDGAGTPRLRLTFGDSSENPTRR